MDRKKYILLVAFACIATIVGSAFLPVAAADGITITKTADREAVEVDSNDNQVNYTITVTNDQVCSEPVDAMLVFDRSGSMDDDGTNPPQPLTSSKSALKNFVDNLNASKDRAGLVSYADTAALNFGLSNNFAGIKTQIDALNANGFTNIKDAITQAHQHMSSNGRNGVQQVLILFSDGQANRPTESTAVAEAIQAASVAKQKGFKVIAIALGSNADTNAMRQIASSNDDYYFAPNTSALNTIYYNISRSFQGISPQTIVTDDLTDMLASMDFVGASNGGVFDGTRVRWNLGDLACKAVVNFQLSMRPKSTLTESVTVTNTVSVSNAVNEVVTSQPVKVRVLAPNLTISVTDHKIITRSGDRNTYEITITNTGEGWARAAELINTIPDYLLQIDDSFNLGGSSIGNNQGKWIFDLKPGGTIVFTVDATVLDNIPDGFTAVTDIAEVSNNGVTKKATDVTYIFKTPPDEPAYELLVCVDDFDQDKVARFGYVNSLKIEQGLEESSIEGANSTTQPPVILLPGKHINVFAVPFSAGESVSWNTRIDKVAHSAVADDNSVRCDDPKAWLGQHEQIIPIPEYGPPDEFIGTSRVFAEPSDPVPPVAVVKITNINEPKSCSEAQVIQVEFSASKGEGVITAAQYSINGGLTWHPINKIKGLGTKKATGVFTTSILSDGNKEIQVRALDNNDQIGESEIISVNIDCEGIVIGSTQFNQRDQLSPLAQGGTVHSIVNEAQYMAIAIAGGPIKATVYATDSDNELQEFELKYNYKLELWETELHFSKPDLYTLEVEAIEKDGDWTKRSTNSVQVVAPGELLTSDKNPISGATIYIYYRADLRSSWDSWNAESFNFDNPQSNSDSYIFLLKPGRYYLKIEHPDYFTSTTKEFVVERYSLLAEDIMMYSKGDILNWWNSHTQTVIPQPINPELTADLKDLLDNQLPDISISDGGVTLSTEDIINSGRPSLIITWTDWGTIPAAQLHQLNNELVNFFSNDTEREFNIIPLGLLEGREENESIVGQGRYVYPIYKPADLSLFDKLFIISAPQYYFIDDRGVVRNILVGNYTYSQIAEELSSLWQVDVNTTNE